MWQVHTTSEPIAGNNIQYTVGGIERHGLEGVNLRFAKHVVVDTEVSISVMPRSYRHLPVRTFKCKFWQPGCNPCSWNCRCGSSQCTEGVNHMKIKFAMDLTTVSDT